MRRPTLGHRLAIWLCGLALTAGCSRYEARQDSPIVTSAPARTPWTARNPATAGPRAEFDLQAVKSDLTSTSPYCPMRKMSVPDTALATSLVPEIPPDVQQVALVTGGTLPDAIPPDVTAAAQGIPATPPLHAPVPQLGFEEAEECCSPCATAPPMRIVATSACCADPCSACSPTPACTACSPCATMPCTACPTCSPCAAAAPAPPAPPPGVAIDAPPPCPRGEPAPRRRSFGDITASPCFGHAPDYAWLSGQVEYSRILGTWRLRYASVDETDRFAGSVTLVENGHVGYLRDGEYVRVEGHLVNPRAEGCAPAYRIESFKVIDNPNDPSSPPSISTASAP